METNQQMDIVNRRYYAGKMNGDPANIAKLFAAASSDLEKSELFDILIERFGEAVLLKVMDMDEIHRLQTIHENAEFLKVCATLSPAGRKRAILFGLLTPAQCSLIINQAETPKERNELKSLAFASMYGGDPYQAEDRLRKHKERDKVPNLFETFNDGGYHAVLKKFQEKYKALEKINNQQTDPRSTLDDRSDQVVADEPIIITTTNKEHP